jgi:hypothetical protein
MEPVTDATWSAKRSQALAVLTLKSDEDLDLSAVQNVLEKGQRIAKYAVLRVRVEDPVSEPVGSYEQLVGGHVSEVNYALLIMDRAEWVAVHKSTTSKAK